MSLPAVLLGGALAVAVVPVEPPAAPSPAAPTREMRPVMGTTADVWVGGVASPAAAFDAAFAALDAVDAGLSPWKESELVALNRSGEARVSPVLFETLRRALELAEASAGAFDPTLEPLLRARGAYGGPAQEPSRRETQRLLARVGFRRVSLEAATGRVRLAPGTALDLGGIAKGYAVDVALDALRRAGARRALVDLGSSSQGVFGDTLTLEAADPLRAGQPSWAVFTLRDACVSSSGASQRGGHILDPRTGRPAQRVLAATVVAAECIEADALSTALFVLGAEQGLALVARRGAAGFVLLRERARPLVHVTPGFVERYGLEVAPWVRLREAAP